MNISGSNLLTFTSDSDISTRSIAKDLLSSPLPPSRPYPPSPPSTPPASSPPDPEAPPPLPPAPLSYPVTPPLPVNTARLTYHARMALRKNKLSEAESLYSEARSRDPEDGRSWLGLSRVAARRHQHAPARSLLLQGLAYSPGNPFLLQALGSLHERSGELALAERRYAACVRAEPGHAAGWISLAQLRTRKLARGAAAGRACYQAAELHLGRRKDAGESSYAFLYTAWADLEYKACGNAERGRELCLKALARDPRCSAALLLLGGLCRDTGDAKGARAA